MAELTDIPLADAIKHLRDELITAVQEGAGKGVRFRLGAVKLNLEVAATSTG
ncbi:MAG: trypco2 family protein, partial [Thermomicrobiales bacterium]